MVRAVQFSVRIDLLVQKVSSLCIVEFQRKARFQCRCSLLKNGSCDSSCASGPGATVPVRFLHQRFGANEGHSVAKIPFIDVLEKLVGMASCHALFKFILNQPMGLFQSFSEGDLQSHRSALTCCRGELMRVESHFVGLMILVRRLRKHTHYLKCGWKAPN